LSDQQQYQSKPLSPETWPDLVDLFGTHGASSGCWCMFFRMPRKEFHSTDPEEHRKMFEQVAKSGAPAGLLAYDGEKAVGWCAVAPRTEYTAIVQSRLYQPVDDQPIWSLTCFFIRRGFRHKGVSRFLIARAIEYARDHGAAAVEAYPMMHTGSKVQEASAYTGFDTVFADLGFELIENRSGKHPIMRYPIQ
jgi:GNAT superfamily N-acetyltransferase